MPFFCWLGYIVLVFHYMSEIMEHMYYVNSSIMYKQVLQETRQEKVHLHVTYLSQFESTFSIRLVSCLMRLASLSDCIKSQFCLCMYDNF